MCADGSTAVLSEALPTKGHAASRTPVGRLPPPDLLDHILIIRALMLREAKLKNLKMGVLGRFIDLIMPSVIISVHYFVFIALNRVMPAGIPVELFVLAGFTTWFVFRNTSARVVRGEAQHGTILMPGVTSLHLLIAGGLWECAAMTFMLYGGLFFCAVVLGTGRPAQHPPEPADLHDLGGYGGRLQDDFR